MAFEGLKIDGFNLIAPELKYPYDAVIYKIGKYAVAKDRWGNTIVEPSENADSVRTSVINYVRNNGGGVILDFTDDDSFITKMVVGDISLYKIKISADSSKIGADIIPITDNAIKLGNRDIGLLFKSVDVYKIRMKGTYGGSTVSPDIRIDDELGILFSTTVPVSSGTGGFRLRYLDKATSTNTLVNSAPLELLASVWSTTLNSAKTQKFVIEHEPLGVNYGRLRFKFIKIDGTVVALVDFTTNPIKTIILYNDIYMNYKGIHALKEIDSANAVRISLRPYDDLDRYTNDDMVLQTNYNNQPQDRIMIKGGQQDTEIFYTHDNGATLIKLNETLIRYDDTQSSFVNTTSSTIKSFRMYKRGWKYLKLILSVWGDGTNTVYVEIAIDGTTVDSFSTTASSETFFTRNIDISSFADGIHTVDINMYVSGGTGYTQFMEAWVW